jgi:hypothetical protein
MQRNNIVSPAVLPGKAIEIIDSSWVATDRHPRVVTGDRYLKSLNNSRS